MLPGGGGVCALTDEQGRLIRTLSAQNLRRSLAHRLAPPRQAGRRPQADLRAIARKLWWRPTFSVFETYLAYLQITRRLAPDRYRRDLAFGPAWFARVNLQDRHPRWVADKYAFSPPTVDIGPFDRRSGSLRFIELLEDLFDLCRNFEVLRQAPSGQACAYKEMGRCPAPCDGSISMDQYRRAVAASVEFACGRIGPRLRQLEESMNAAASRLQFEVAARIRERISRARTILAHDGRLRQIPESFRYLVVQRAGGTARVKPFFVDRGQVTIGGATQLGKIDQAAAEWTDKMRRTAGRIDADHAAERCEGIWLVSHFLIKRDRALGLFLHESQLSAPQDLAETVRLRFGKVTGRKASNPIEVDRSGASPLQ